MNFARINARSRRALERDAGAKNSFLPRGIRYHKGGLPGAMGGRLETLVSNVLSGKCRNEGRQLEALEFMTPEQIALALASRLIAGPRAVKKAVEIIVKLKDSGAVDARQAAATVLSKGVKLEKPLASQLASMVTPAEKQRVLRFRPELADAFP